MYAHMSLQMTRLAGTQNQIKPCVTKLVVSKKLSGMARPRCSPTPYLENVVDNKVTNGTH